MSHKLYMLGRMAAAHPWRVIGVWFVIAATVIAASATVGKDLEDSFAVPGLDSQVALDLLTEAQSAQAGATARVVVTPLDDAASFADSATMESLGEARAVFAELPQLVAVSEPILSEDARIAMLNLQYPVLEDLSPDNLDDLKEALEEARVGSPLQIEAGGELFFSFEEAETGTGELIGLAAAVVILLLAFGSVIAMGLPIGMALFGLALGISSMSLISYLIDIPSWAPQMGSMIGLGVGIDYALFIVTRYRNSLAVGHTKYDAVGIAIDTAGRSVVFAGLTVVVSLLGMLLIGLAFISGLGIGAAATVAITMIASITLLPALLGMVGDRVEVSRVRGIVAAGFVSLALLSGGLGAWQVAAGAALVAVSVLLLGFFLPPLKRVIPHREEKPIRETLSYRWSRVIQAHPWAAMLVGGGLLLVLAAPVLSLRLGFSDEGNFPEGSTTREAYDLIADGFGPGFNGPLLITAVLDSPEAGAQVQELAATIEATDGVASVSPIPSNFAEPQASEAFLIQVIPDTAPQDEATDELVKTLREDVIPTANDGLDVNVTGAVPANIDFTSYLGARILLFFGVVLTLSFLLLMAVFRSIVVPIKAVIMNVLSIASAYGIVVAIFQWGWFGDLFGIAGAPIEPFIPMMLFAIVFGLSMDYEVFLLSRVKEEYEKTGDARNSVADGLAATARVITAAAAIMIVVFGSFMFEDNRIIKLFGLGLGMAVFLDASLVRMLLVPATMELLGDRNWWLPGWLDRIIPNLNVEGTEPPPPGEASGGSLSEPEPEPEPEPVLT